MGVVGWWSCQWNGVNHSYLCLAFDFAKGVNSLEYTVNPSTERENVVSKKTRGQITQYKKKGIEIGQNWNKNQWDNTIKQVILFYSVCTLWDNFYFSCSPWTVSWWVLLSHTGGGWWPSVVLKWIWEVERDWLLARTSCSQISYSWLGCRRSIRYSPCSCHPTSVSRVLLSWSACLMHSRTKVTEGWGVKLMFNLTQSLDVLRIFMLAQSEISWFGLWVLFLPGEIKKKMYIFGWIVKLWVLEH